MNFSNVKVSVKLGAAFLLIVFLTVVMGAFSLIQLSRINANTEEMATAWIPSIKQLDETQGLLNVMRRAELQHVIGVTAEDKKPEADRIAASRASLAEIGKKTKARLLNPAERTLFDQYENELNAYYLTSTKLLALSDIGPAEAVAALEYVNGESRIAFGKIFKSTEAMIAINSKGVDGAYAGSQATYANSRTSVVFLVALTIALAVVMGVWIVRQITRPLASAVAAAKEFTHGNLTQTIPHVGTDEPSQLLDELESMRKGIARVVTNVRHCSDGVANASAEIAQGNLDLSNRTEQQAGSLQATSNSMDQLGATVRQNADNARQANQLALNASTVAVKGGEVVNQVVATMKDINDSSQRIADIISVIDGIAFQTNILALNAAVEAARAGEQGRGFAVVASEVRSLAGRSATAAREIKVLIDASVERVERGTALVDKAGVTMTEVVTSIQRVTDIVGEISSASNEQAKGVAQVGESITLMDQATQQNAALVEQMAAAAGSLKSQAHELVQVVSEFRVLQDQTAHPATPLLLRHA